MGSSNSRINMGHIDLLPIESHKCESTLRHPFLGWFGGSSYFLRHPLHLRYLLASLVLWISMLTVCRFLVQRVRVVQASWNMVPLQCARINVQWIFAICSLHQLERRRRTKWLEMALHHRRNHYGSYRPGWIFCLSWCSNIPKNLFLQRRRD
jgi:hypothetical protein